MIRILKKYRENPEKLEQNLQFLIDEFYRKANKPQTDSNGRSVPLDNLPRKIQEAIWYYQGVADGLNKAYHLVFGNKSFNQIKNE